jgi:hypothetical protein
MNLFHRPMQPSWPVRQIGLSYQAPPGWESIPGLLKRFTNTIYGDYRNREGKGLSYRPARLHRMAEFIPWNRFLGLTFKNTVSADKRCKGGRGVGDESESVDMRHGLQKYSVKNNVLLHFRFSNEEPFDHTSKYCFLYSKLCSRNS